MYSEHHRAITKHQKAQFNSLIGLSVWNTGSELRKEAEDPAAWCSTLFSRLFFFFFFLLRCVVTFVLEECSPTACVFPSWISYTGKSGCRITINLDSIQSCFFLYYYYFFASECLYCWFDCSISSPCFIIMNRLYAGFWLELRV